MDITPDPDCCRGMDSDMALGSSPGLDASLAPGTRTDYQISVVPSVSNMVLRHQHGLWLLTRPWLSTRVLVVTRAKDISSDTGCYRATDSDMVLGCIPGPDVTMIPGGSAGYLSWHGPMAA